MNKKILFWIVLGIMAVGVIFFSRFGILVWRQKQNSGVDQTPNMGEQPKKLTIVATFYPLEHFARKVGRELIDVRSLTPSGGEPHDYEPTPQDIITIQKADVFILNGAGLEPWAEKLIPELSNEKIKVLNMSKQITLLQDEEDGGADPHFWLDPIHVQTEVQELRDTFISLDPQNAENYKQNAEKYLQTLAELNASFQAGLASCSQRQIITSHNAFAYVGARYNFTVESIAGFSPTEEPSAKHLAGVTKLVSEKKIKYIFTETLVNPKLSETLAKEAKVQTLILNPIEGLTPAEIEEGKNYESLMKENLRNLRLAMECK